MRTFLLNRLKSFVYAFRGAQVLVSTQHNARIHMAATVLVLVLGYRLDFTSGEWIAVMISFGMVWCAEALNTAIELLGDEISLERRERIGRANDVAAFAVLAAAIAAMIVGVIVLTRHL